MKAINLDNVQEFTGFDKAVGGFVLGVVDVEDIPEKEYLKITYDIAEGEKKNFFTTRKKDTGWDLPNLIRSYKDSALPFFKGFVTSVENSNKGYKWDNDEKKLVGKLFGGVLAEEEYQKQTGNVGTRTYVSDIHSADKIRKGDFTVPELKKLAVTTSTNANPFTPPQPSANPFEPAPFDVSDDSVPF